MANAVHDQNHIPVMLAVSNADGTTTLPLQVSPTTNCLLVEDGVAGLDMSNEPGKRDENRIVVGMAVSSVDGVTPVELYADSVTGKLLIQST